MEEDRRLGSASLGPSVGVRLACEQPPQALHGICALHTSILPLLTSTNTALSASAGMARVLRMFDLTKVLPAGCCHAVLHDSGSHEPPSPYSLPEGGCSVSYSTFQHPLGQIGWASTQGGGHAHPRQAGRTWDSCSLRSGTGSQKLKPTWVPDPGSLAGRSPRTGKVVQWRRLGAGQWKQRHAAVFRRFHLLCLELGGRLLSQQMAEEPQ